MIRVIESGLQTIPISSARHGMEQYGVPTGGPMDWVSHLLANRLVGNEDAAGALEITLIPPKLLFQSACCIALVGGEADFSLSRGGETRAIPMGQTAEVLPGDILHGSPMRVGMRAYLAISGGILLPSIRAVALKRGDVLRLGGNAKTQWNRLMRLPRPVAERFALLRVISGVHAGRFSAEALGLMRTSRYIYSGQSDRMGVRLEGAPLPFAPGQDGNIISEAVMQGDIQVTSSGQPILLTADCQTVGGYAKIAHVITADLPIAGQLCPGAGVRFRFVSVEEAHGALKKLYREMDSGLIMPMQRKA